MSIPCRFFLSVFLVLLFVSCEQHLEDAALSALPDDLLADSASFEAGTLLWSRDSTGKKAYTALFASDVTGSHKAELVLESASTIQIVTLAGQLVEEIPLMSGEQIGLLYDLDRDGKTDIFLDAPSGPASVLRVVNGKGHTVEQVSLAEKGSGFFSSRIESAIDPDTAGAIFLILQTNAETSKRGYMKFSLPDLKKQWFFNTPFTPIQLFPSDRDSALTENTETSSRFYPGMQTTYNGMNSFTGVQGAGRREITTLESDFTFFTISGDGSFSSPVDVASVGNLLLRGQIRYIAQEEDYFVLIHQSDYHSVSAFRILLIDSEGSMHDSTPFYEGTVIHPVKTAEKSTQLVVTVTTPTGQEYYYLDLAGAAAGSLSFTPVAGDRFRWFSPYTVKNDANLKNPPPYNTVHLVLMDVKGVPVCRVELSGSTVSMYTLAVY